VFVDDPRGALGVLRIDLGSHEHRAVPKRPRVEDRRDLADDPLVEQPLGSDLDLVGAELGLAGDQLERPRVEREARLQQVHQPLVGLVEGYRRAALAGADLGPGYSHPAASLAK
jgi:hypothetical protein